MLKWSAKEDYFLKYGSYPKLAYQVWKASDLTELECLVKLGYNKGCP